ncbi:MAG: hypothetical protein QNJ97_21605 [Myxococcota bacterium]|nr:hypothetical protein [Myxococcota bacterium]
MNLEQLAIFGIAVFGFMAIASAFNAVRTIKRIVRRPDNRRFRRRIAGTEAALYAAQSIVGEIAEKHAKEVTASRAQTHRTPKLKKALDEGEAYFLTRVEPRHRPLFEQVVQELIFKKTGDSTS